MLKFSIFDISKFLRLSEQFKVLRIFYTNFENIEEKLSINGITNDSRKIEASFMYVAIRGYKADGHDYTAQAYAKEVACVLVELDFFDEAVAAFKGKNKILIIGILNTRKALALLAAYYYGFPSQDLKMIGITGTNGKTTTSYLLYFFLIKLGYKVGLIGTLGIFIHTKKIESRLTTPDSIDLQRILKQMKEESVEYVFMEISSHALFLDRGLGLELDGVLFTSFSQDHLDFHKNMEDYFQAKLLILDLLAQSKKKKKKLLFNAKIKKSWRKLFLEKAKHLDLKAHFYGLKSHKNSLHYELKLLKVAIEGSTFKLGGFSKKIQNLFLNKILNTSLLGKYNLENLLAVLAILDFFNLFNNSFHKIISLFNELRIPGRYEKIFFPQKKSWIIIDYAHTENALQLILSSISKELKPKKLICVFGCGGDRDIEKRPLMGKCAAYYSDLLIVTNDNPRSEDPEKIVRDILKGIPKTFESIEIILQRKKAIERAIDELTEKSVALIAGKGHETEQILEEENIYFNDYEVASCYIRSLDENFTS